jgi:photosystem II stability/assembly factor-like uncharacterized protein
MHATAPRRLLTCLAAIAFGAATAAPAFPAWRPLGPEGGEVFSLAVDERDDVVWAGTANGVYRSADGARRWQRAPAGALTAPSGESPVLAVAVAPVGPAVVYASVRQHGIFASTDDGTTWERRTTGLDATHADLLVPHPNIPDLIFALTPLGVARSDDGGEQWRRLASPPSVFTEQALAAHPTSRRILWLGAASGLYSTADGGGSWTPRGGNLFRNVRAVVVDPEAPSTVWVAADRASDGRPGVWRSGNGGASWRRDDATLPAGAAVTAFAAVRGSGAVFAAVWGHGVAARRGGGWEAPQGPRHVVRGGLVERLDFPDGLYAAVEGLSQGGVFATSDDGRRWHRRSRGLRAWRLTTVAVDPAQPQNLFAGSSDGGVLRSVDGGRSWSAANNGLPTGRGKLRVDALEIDRSTPRSLYAAVDGGLYRSRDGGTRWAALASPGLGGVTLLDAHPTQPGLVLAGSTDGLFRSTNGGRSWVRAGGTLDSVWIRDLERSPASPTVVWAAAVQRHIAEPQGGVFRSDDGGFTWHQVSGQPASQVAADPLSAEGVVVYFDDLQLDELARSDDGGASFQLLPTPDAYVTDLALHPLAADTLYLATRSGVLRSVDGGATWAAWNDGLPHPIVAGLAFGGQPWSMYAATAGGGLAVRAATEGASTPATAAARD